MTEIYDLKVEHLTNPVGIGELSPRFSWRLKSQIEKVLQTAYHLMVLKEDVCVWDSGKVTSAESLNIHYEGEPLKSRERLKVKLVVDTNVETGLTAETEFEMGLLERSDWQCHFIEMEDDFTDNKMKPAPYIRKKIVVKKPLSCARAYQTAHGTYRFWINGKEGSDRRFAPGNTSYYERLQYQVDDITPLLQQGENIWAIKVGDGWWRGAVGAFSERNNYGFRVQFLGQIILEYADGTTEWIAMDEDAKTATGGTLAADPKFGTVFDATMEPEDWKTNRFDDSSWKKVHYATGEHLSLEPLIAEQTPKIREKEHFTPKILKDKNGDFILDFGQNIAGYVKMTVRDCKSGQEIILDHGEALNDGKFDLSNVIQPGAEERDEMFQRVIYCAKGEKLETFCPEFSIFGFRYVRIQGYDVSKIQPEDFAAIAVYSDLDETFSFSCSNTLINQMVKNVLWSQKGNYLDVPTDCPTRERAPWTGDASVYSKTASEMMDVYTFFEKWMKDVAIEQQDDGMIPSIAPSIAPHREQKNEFGMELDGSAGWGDVADILPYNLYLAYGDKQILINQYESAKAWVDYMIENAKNKNDYYKDADYYMKNADGSCDGDFIWDTKFHWGEWSEPNFIMESLGGDFISDRIMTGNPVVATAYLRYSSLILSKIADVIEKKADAEFYLSYSNRVAEIYDKYLIRKDGSILYAEEGRQAAYARALQFQLVFPNKKEAVKEKLLSLIEKENYHLNTGFLSTNFLLNLLADEGEADAAYRILEQTDAPSWLYPVTKGATTTLESWDGIDEFFGSYNHYSLGAVCDFLFSYTCGIKIDETQPGYKHFYLKPLACGSMKSAQGSFLSPYGTITSRWEKGEGKINYLFEVPCNSSATVFLPDGRTEEIQSGKHEFSVEI